jgi:hypothetical protein
VWVPKLCTPLLLPPLAGPVPLFVVRGAPRFCSPDVAATYGFRVGLPLAQTPATMCKVRDAAPDVGWLCGDGLGFASGFSTTLASCTAAIWPQHAVPAAAMRAHPSHVRGGTSGGAPRSRDRVLTATAGTAPGCHWDPSPSRARRAAAHAQHLLTGLIRSQQSFPSSQPAIGASSWYSHFRSALKTIIVWSYSSHIEAICSRDQGGRGATRKACAQRAAATQRGSAAPRPPPRQGRAALGAGLWVLYEQYRALGRPGRSARARVVAASLGQPLVRPPPFGRPAAPGPHERAPTGWPAARGAARGAGAVGDQRERPELQLHGSFITIGVGPQAR